MAAAGGTMEMKVSTKKGVGFFIRAASVFLQGADAKEAEGDVEGKPARAPVSELQVSGLGEAIGVAISVAKRMEEDGLAEIAGVETLYPDMENGGSSPQMRIRLRRLERPSLDVPTGGLAVVTWNLAAINNNPFEYWMTLSDSAYAQLMADVEGFIESPGERDVMVEAVLSTSCIEDLMSLMKAEGWQGVDTVEEMWKADLCKRKIISGVLKDKELGAKRLCSMPDRFTNTIFCASGAPAFRPSVINHSSNSLGSVAEWWPQWSQFMFKEQLEVPSGNGATKKARPCELLPKIKKAKYPAISEEEEAVSVPLQCLCLAIFDAILVHMLQVLSPNGSWQRIKSSICDATFRQKNAKTSKILQSYSEASVMCLQECSVAYIDQLRAGKLSQTHHVIAPAKVDAQRDQNSALLLSRSAFPNGMDKELTDDVIAALEASSPVEVGDLIVIRATSASGISFVLASFHGDTNGKATAPVVRATCKVLASQGSACKLVFGMDANTYLAGSSSNYGAKEFLEECRGAGLKTCWAEGQDMASCLTTCNARTYLQPQLNKACRSAQKIQKGDVNPKDHILFGAIDFEAVSTFKDNTGKRRYEEGMCFPTLDFPSDHGLVATALKPVN
eukprot:TRINITY_DN62618_c0_g1_i1.p1 TRINITY_DN62618_c0_g1~~TRINITY_DN62618_c0_g1_i1.p1  ORF type:complete len:637 (+),score=126.48 TRINITY_DN62618_c0_g1_i1:62-1912(+)